MPNLANKYGDYDDMLPLIDPDNKPDFVSNFVKKRLAYEKMSIEKETNKTNYFSHPFIGEYTGGIKNISSTKSTYTVKQLVLDESIPAEDKT